jgi:hypothetical protein
MAKKVHRLKKAWLKISEYSAVRTNERFVMKWLNTPIAALHAAPAVSATTAPIRH